MADKSVGARIELKGEKEYSAAIKEAQRNLRVLKSELKAESAELGKNASEQDKNAAKAKSLKAQIAEQEKIVETMKAALEEARQKYGENSDAVAGWEIRLNSARAVLGNMRSDLENAGGGVRDMGGSLQEAGRDADTATVATRSLAEALKDVGTFAGGISEKIEGLFSGMVETVSGAIGAVWDEMVSLAARANGWVDLAGFWNTSATNIQKWYHAVEGSHNSFDTMQGAVKRIVHGDAQKIAELAGVSREGYEDDWEYAVAVMDSLDRIGRTQGHEARQSIMEQIFGAKKVEDVQDILNDWQTIQDNLARFDTENGGVGMTEEQITQMSTLAEKVDAINHTWSAFKDSWLAGLAPLALDLTSNVQGALDALISFMNADTAEEREAALEDFKTNLTDFFTKLGEAISEAAGALDEIGGELQESDNKMVQTIGKILSSLSNLLEWFSNPDNITQVVHGFEALAAFWLAGKGAEFVTTISSLAANLHIIKGLSTAGAAGGAGMAASKTLGIGFASLGSSLGTAATAASPLLLPAGVLAAGLLPAYFAQKDTEREWVEKQEGAEQKIAEIEEAGGATEWTEFARAATEALGPDRDEKGNYEHDITGLFLSNQRGGAGLNFENLMDLQGYDQTQLQAMLDGRTAAGYDAWNLLQRAWQYQDLDPIQETELLETIRDAALEWSENGAQNADMTNSLLDTQDYATQTNQALKKSADDLSKTDFEGAVRRGASEGLSGVKVYLDGYAVGNLVASYVSEAIARDMDT